MAKVKFFGGAMSVTGANYLIETEKSRTVVEVGMLQGCSDCSYANFEDFHYEPRTVDAVFITHAHIDHIGRLPKLIKEGFNGPVYTSEPTAALAPIMLEDAHGIDEEEAEQHNREPMYSQTDLLESIGYLHPKKYNQRFSVTQDIDVRLQDAGHILGSTIFEFWIHQGEKEIKLVFSGDLGNTPMPLMKPPAKIDSADYVFVESAYGDRIHEDVDVRRQKLEEAIESIIKNKGTLVIPSFALERTQEILFELNYLVENKHIPSVPIFLDSPLAIKATEVYKKFSHYFNKVAYEQILSGDKLFQFPRLEFTETTQESRRINNTPSPKVIIAGSGMSTAGRILHHEKRYLPDPKNMLLIIGYQAHGTLGRRVLDGASEVKIHGEIVPVRAQIKAIGGYSAHADQPALVGWVGNIRGVKKVFCVQGEKKSAEALATRIKSVLNIEAVAPRIMNEFEF